MESSFFLFLTSMVENIMISAAVFNLIASFSFSYINGGVLVCGGRSGTEVHQDCVRYFILYLYNLHFYPLHIIFGNIIFDLECKYKYKYKVKHYFKITKHS